jgi:hypothetical protein
MSTTLSRRLRRIGLTPTTYNETQEQRLVTEIVDGKKQQVEKTITKRTAVRNHETLTPEEIVSRNAVLRSEYKIRNQEFRLDRKKARGAAQVGKVASKPVGGIVSKKVA